MRLLRLTIDGEADYHVMTSPNRRRIFLETPARGRVQWARTALCAVPTYNPAGEAGRRSKVIPRAAFAGASRRRRLDGGRDHGRCDPGVSRRSTARSPRGSRHDRALLPRRQNLPARVRLHAYGSLVAGVQETKMMSGTAPSDTTSTCATRRASSSSRPATSSCTSRVSRRRMEPAGAIGLMSRNESLSAKASSECRSCAAAGQSSRWTRCALASCTRWRSIPAGGYQAGSYAAARSAHCRR